MGTPDVHRDGASAGGLRGVDQDELRTVVLRGFVETGQAPSVQSIARRLGADEGEVRDAVRRLGDSRLAVVSPDGQELAMVHPFSQHNMGFVVAGASQKWWGGCAWEAFAIPSLVEQTCLVATHCRGCGRAIALDVDPASPPTGDHVAHFLVPVRDMWRDVLFTCHNQVLFCSVDHVDDWLERTHSDRGGLLSLPLLWEVATDWYRGRLSRTARPRTPAEIDDFWREHGLTDEFWHTGQAR